MERRIIIKKKGGHGGHHGGAWKVAYADFVTAMMALFIVLWLLNTSKQLQKAIGGYFKDPSGTSKLVGNGQQGSGDTLPLTKDDLPKLKEELEKTIRKVSNFEKLSKQIEMTVTAEGLRIELMETPAGTFFGLGSPKPSPSGIELLTALAQQISKVPNQVSIEGHTDAKPYPGDAYSNWELSVDRANAARRIIMGAGVKETQVAQVRGYADRKLRYKDDPENPGNRRITVIVQYLEKEVPGNTVAAAEKAAAENPATQPAENAESKPAEDHPATAPPNHPAE